MRDAVVVCVTNGKGGVGKTSLTANIAGHAAAAGWRTLVIDLDAQGDLGEDLGYSHDGDSDGGLGLHDAVLRGVDLNIISSVRGRERLDAVAGGQWTTRLSRTLRDERTSNGLSETLTTITNQYDLVLVDTPPEMESEVVRQAIAAARWLIIPTGRDNASVRGIERVEQVRHLAAEAGSKAELLGVVLFDFGIADSRILADVRGAVESGGVRVFDTFIRHNRRGTMQMRDDGMLAVEYGQIIADELASSNRYEVGQNKSLGVYDGLAGDYRQLTKEILEAVSD